MGSGLSPPGSGAVYLTHRNFHHLRVVEPPAPLLLASQYRCSETLVPFTRQSARSGGHVRVVCLSGVAGCLLVVGIESGTFLRHVFQIAPIAMVLGYAIRRKPWTAPAALGLLGSWAFFMGLIWLYLAGVQTFFTGSYTLLEIALTILIGGFSVVGIVASWTADRTMGRKRRILTAVAFAALQLGVMWLSLFGDRILAMWSGA